MSLAIAYFLTLLSNSSKHSKTFIAEICDKFPEEIKRFCDNFKNYLLMNLELIPNLILILAYKSILKNY